MVMGYGGTECYWVSWRGRSVLRAMHKRIPWRVGAGFVKEGGLVDIRDGEA